MFKTDKPLMQKRANILNNVLKSVTNPTRNNPAGFIFGYEYAQGFGFCEIF